MTMTLWQYINDTSTRVLLCVNRTTDTHLDNGAGHMVRRTQFLLLGRIWAGKCRYENCINQQQAVRYSPLTHLHMQVYRSNVLVICACCYHAVRGISDKVVHTCIYHLHNTSTIHCLTKPPVAFCPHIKTRWAIIVSSTKDNQRLYCQNYLSSKHKTFSFIYTQVL